MPGEHQAVNGGLAAPAPAASDLGRTISALQDPTRRAILLAFLRDQRPRTVDDAAQLAGVHRTVAFGHLERLTDLGFLAKGKRRGRLGKPAALYAPRESILSVQYPVRQFVVLAGLLASVLANLGPEGPEAAKAAGRRFGEDLAGSKARSVDDALAPVQVLGGEYSVEGDRVHADNCIFFEACSQASQVICGLHAGILQGALRGAGMTLTVKPAGHVAPFSCDYELTRA